MRSWRAGSLTLGIVLMVFGITLVISNVSGAFTIFEVALWWPVVLILLGCEVLAALRFSDEKPPKVKFDGGSIFLMTLLLIFSIGISTVTLSAHLVPGGVDTIRNALFSENAVVNTSYSLNSQSIKLNNIVGGNVSVSPYDGNETIVDAVVTVRNMTNKILEQKKDEIISIDKESGLISTVQPEYSSHINSIQADFNIKVPKGRNIEIKNQEGTVMVTKIDNNISIDNKSGSIIANECTGSINVNSRGIINMDGIKGNITILSKGGDIRVADFSAKASINAIDGNIELLPGDKITEDVTVKCSNGNLKMNLAKSQGGTLNTAVYSGEINTGIKGDIKEDGGAKKMSCTLPGEGPGFDITVHNGNVSLISGSAE